MPMATRTCSWGKYVTGLALTLPLVGLLLTAMSCAGSALSTSASSTLTAHATTTVTAQPTTSVPTTTSTTEPTTTTESTTTTTEFTVGIDPDLISKDRTLADVTGRIENGRFLTKPVGKIPADLQKQFASKNPGKKILYVGKANQGDKMNAVITDKVWLYGTVGDGLGPVFSFAGGNPDRPTKDFYLQATMEFLDVVLIPESRDFYIRGQNQLTGSEIYIRIATDYKDTRDVTVVYPFYLSASTQDVPIHKYIAWPNFLAAHKLSDIIRPGDILDISFMFFGNGSLSDPKNITLTAYRDDKGVQYAGVVIFTVFNEADEAAYEQLFK